MVSSRVFADSNLDPRFRAGLVGHWIGGGSGLTWFDRSGSGKNGTLTGGPGWTLGAEGKRAAVGFDGIDDYVSLPSGVDTSVAWSIVSRFRHTSTARMVLLNQGDTASPPYLAIEVNQNEGGAGSFGVRSQGAGGFNTYYATGLVANAWNHIAFVRRSTSMADVEAYLNGQSRPVTDGGSLTGTTNNATTLVRIGSREFGGVSLPFIGVVEEVRLYNRALSAAEIATLANPAYSPIIGGGLICGL